MALNRREKVTLKQEDVTAGRWDSRSDLVLLGAGAAPTAAS